MCYLLILLQISYNKRLRNFLLLFVTQLLNLYWHKLLLYPFPMATVTTRCSIKINIVSSSWSQVCKLLTPCNHYTKINNCLTDHFESVIGSACKPRWEWNQQKFSLEEYEADCPHQKEGVFKIFTTCHMHQYFPEWVRFRISRALCPFVLTSNSMNPK